MKIELVYLGSDSQTFHQSLAVTKPCNIKDALLTSRLFDAHPELSIDLLTVGIFSQKVPLSHVLKDGERIEIYRDLTITPMEKRRLLASKRK
tara:strand:- start:330 stop:605 length:276 start_codon:yes stop_codon:yes gene_type:complete